MKPELSEFFSLLGKAKKEKEEEFDNLLKEANINLDVLVKTVSSGIKKAEVEVRHNWKGDFDFPFSTVNIPSRKKKFFDGNCLYFSINKNLTRCMMIDDKDILESPLEENPNRFVSSNEMFYKVSTSKCKSLQIKDYQ